MSGNINENTFVGLTYHELSQEGFGLPSIRSFRVASEEEIWKNPLVLKATDKVKQYAVKNRLSLNFSVDTKKLPENILTMLLAQRGVSKVEDSVIKECLKFVKVRKVNGINIISIDTVLTQKQYVGLCVVFLIVLGVSLPSLMKLSGTLAGKIGSKVYEKTGNVAIGEATSNIGGYLGGFLSARLAIKLSNIAYYTIGNQLKIKNESKNLRIFGSWALFKNENGEISAKRFCNCVIDPSIKSSEDLIVSDKTDEVSMTDLVENEISTKGFRDNMSENGNFYKLWYSEILNKVILPEIENECKIDKSSVAMALTKRGGADYQYSGDLSNFISDRRNDSLLTADKRISELLTTKYNKSYRFVDGINSTEAWYDDLAYSLEETGEDEVSMTDLVENETTVEEDAGKDSEIINIDIPQEYSEHNEEASAGGILTGDNKNELEVKETSEEVLGITDYDLYSEDEYKSLEGVFDPDDLK